jgi:hypothetical protein
MDKREREKIVLEEMLAEVENQMRRNNAEALKTAMRRLAKKEIRKPA